MIASLAPDAYRDAVTADAHWPAAQRADVENALVLAGLAAQERSLDAKQGSRLGTNHAYGSTFWLALHNEVCAFLKGLPGVTIVPKRGNRGYPLAVVNGTLVFPTRHGVGSNGVDDLAVAWSQLKASLLMPPGSSPPVVQGALDLGNAFGAVDESAMAATILEGASRTILAAYDCEAGSGLRGLTIGEVSNFTQPDGKIEWAWHRDVCLDVTNDRSSVAPVLDDVRDFNDDPEPSVVLGLRAISPAAEASSQEPIQ